MVALERSRGAFISERRGAVWVEHGGKGANPALPSPPNAEAGWIPGSEALWGPSRSRA